MPVSTNVLFLSLALVATNALAASCGAPPSGILRAERVDGVTASRAEPGLFEGPVWIKDALYFSDFSFAKGFPSRVRKLAADGKVGTAIEDSGSNGLAVDAAGVPGGSPPITFTIGSTPFGTLRLTSTSPLASMTASWERLRCTSIPT